MKHFIVGWLFGLLAGAMVATSFLYHPTPESAGRMVERAVAESDKFRISNVRLSAPCLQQAPDGALIAVACNPDTRVPLVAADGSSAVYDIAVPPGASAIRVTISGANAIGSVHAVPR